jgi:hypothetical protein
MKKIAALTLAGMIGFGGVTAASHVFASGNNDSSSPKIAIQDGKMDRLGFLSKYKDLLHQANDLKLERLKLRESLVSKRDELIDLLVSAKENGDTESLKEAKAIRQKLKAERSELRSLQLDIREQRKAVKESAKNRDEEQTKENISKLLELQTSMNKELEDRSTMLDEMIAALKN